MDGRERKVLEAVQGIWTGTPCQYDRVLPYPIQVFDRDGTAVLINRAALEMIGIRSIEDSKMYTGEGRSFPGKQYIESHWLEPFDAENGPGGLSQQVPFYQAF